MTSIAQNGEDEIQTYTKSKTEATTHQISSCAFLIDPDEGTAVKFIPMHVVHSQKRAKIKKSNIVSEVEY